MPKEQGQQKNKVKRGWVRKAKNKKELGMDNEKCMNGQEEKTIKGKTGKVMRRGMKALKRNQEIPDQY